MRIRNNVGVSQHEAFRERRTVEGSLGAGFEDQEVTS